MTSIIDALPTDTLNIALMLLKLLYMVAIALYVAFAILIVRQISLMTGTLVSSLSASIKLVGLVHLIISVFVFVFALVLL